MRLKPAIVPGVVAAVLCSVGASHAFEVTPESTSVWDRYTLDVGTRSGLSMRAAPQLAPNLQPMVGLNFENAHAVSNVRGAWVEALRRGPFSVGPIFQQDRLMALSSTPNSTADLDRAMRFGGFVAFSGVSGEVGRIALTTGRTGGMDLRATRSFKLNDSVSLDIGPTISLGSFERFGYRSASVAPPITLNTAAINPDRAQLGAFGLATAIETRVNERTVARMFAEYARVQVQPGAPALPALAQRDRVDFGFQLSTQIGR